MIPIFSIVDYLTVSTSGLIIVTRVMIVFSIKTLVIGTNTCVARGFVIDTNYGTSQQ